MVSELRNILTIVMRCISFRTVVEAVAKIQSKTLWRRLQ